MISLFKLLKLADTIDKPRLSGRQPDWKLNLETDMTYNVKLDPADLQVMQDHLDALAEQCETERFLIWDHPEYSPIFGDDVPEEVKP